MTALADQGSINDATCRTICAVKDPAGSTSFDKLGFADFIHVLSCTCADGACCYISSRLLLSDHICRVCKSGRWPVQPGPCKHAHKWCGSVQNWMICLHPRQLLTQSS